MTMTTEVERVAVHIAGAEAIAHGRSQDDLRSMSRVKRLVRRLLLDELASYRKGKRFPKNRTHPGRVVPIFIDEEGTRCAMAHLMELGGAADLVDRISSQRNFARVRELAKDFPELLRWLDATGLTIDEAARIQPSYCEVPAACVCGGSFSPKLVAPNPTGMLETTIVGPVGVGSFGSVARVEAIHGDGLGVEIGQHIGVEGGAPAGSVALVPVYRSADGGSSVGVLSTNTATTGSGAGLQFKITNVEAATLVRDAGDPGDAAVVGGDGGGGDAGDDAGVAAIPLSYAVFVDRVCHGPSPHPLSKEQLVSTFLAPDCYEALGKIDHGWLEADCSSDDGLVGCSTTSVRGTGVEAALTTSILIALVGAIVTRRLKARAR